MGTPRFVEQPPIEVNFPDTPEIIMLGTWGWVGGGCGSGEGQDVTASQRKELGLLRAPKGEPRLPVNGEKGSGGRASGGGEIDGVVKGSDPEGTAGHWCLVG